ncbi:hypothetical protein MNBD_GAMMA14-2382 [hydrothermal vent metagenome]|uniref:Uncharacterized protein n=1 Tax=hydrothermal vent metagenome TaxID=652676 RepID=A0A3B0Y200_9ZZZZ
MSYLTYPDFDEREPTDTDNPYVIIEHIMACRESGDAEE